MCSVMPFSDSTLPLVKMLNIPLIMLNKSYSLFMKPSAALAGGAINERRSVND